MMNLINDIINGMESEEIITIDILTDSHRFQLHRENDMWKLLIINTESINPKLVKGVSYRYITIKDAIKELKRIYDTNIINISINNTN